MVRLFVASAVLAATTVPALADSGDLVTRSVVLAPGELDAHLVIEANLQSRRFARPLSIAPDIHLGVTERWTVGVVHSTASAGLIGSGASPCARLDPVICDRRYRGGGVEVRWSWRTGPLAIAPEARLLLRDIDPWKPAVTVGARIRWDRGRLAIASVPYLRLGLANRDRGNREALVVPVWVAAHPVPRIAVALHTGWDGELATLRDGWHVPVGIVAGARITRAIHASFEIGFPSLLGPQNDQKQRAAMLTVGWRGAAVPPAAPVTPTPR